jgi:hypothetical protein
MELLQSARLKVEARQIRRDPVRELQFQIVILGIPSHMNRLQSEFRE